MEKLAIHGGKKVKTTPFGTGKRFGKEELIQLEEAINQNTLFYWLGNKVKEMNKKFADLYGVPYCVATSSGTAALHTALGACGITAGDEVITSPITDMGSIIGIIYQNAIPIFADVDPHTYNITAETIEKCISEKTKAIMVVHLAGNPCDMDPIMELAKKHDIIVLEDAAHAFGAMYKGKKVGTIGDFAAFSFHEVKNITSFGEGGIVHTNVPEMKPQMSRARFLGLDFSKKIKHWLYDISPINGKYGPAVATNSSTTEIQGLGLTLQIARNDKILAERRAAAKYLTERFAENDAIIPQDIGNDDIKPSFHLYLLEIDPAKAGGDIQVLKKKLEEKGVTQIPHFGPLYRFDILRKLGGYDEEAIAATCPNCEEVFYNRFTHLPIYGLSEEQLIYMADAVLESVKEMQEGR